MWLIAIILIIAAAIDIATGISTAFGVCLTMLLAGLGFLCFVVAALQDIAALRQSQANNDAALRRLK